MIINYVQNEQKKNLILKISRQKNSERKWYFYAV